MPEGRDPEQVRRLIRRALERLLLDEVQASAERAQARLEGTAEPEDGTGLTEDDFEALSDVLISLIPSETSESEGWDATDEAASDFARRHHELLDRIRGNPDDIDAWKALVQLMQEGAGSDSYPEEDDEP